MGRTKITLSKNIGLKTDVIKDRSTKQLFLKQFYELHDQFILDKKLEGMSSRTISDHLIHIEYFKKFAKEYDEERCLIDTKFLKRYLQYMVIEKQYKPCTVNIRLTTLKCYCNWLFKNGYTGENFALHLKKVKREEDTIKPLSDSDIKKMLAQPDMSTYAGLRDFTIMIIILDCGIRIQELCNTLITDIDLKNHMLTVRGKVSKTRKSRELPLSKQSMSLLKELIDIAEDNQSEYIFMSSQTGEMLNHDVVIHNFGKYGKKAGIKMRCTPNVFRHVWALNAVKQGLSVFYIQKIMGHVNITTSRQYVQLETSELRKSHEKLNFVQRYF